MKKPNPKKYVNEFFKYMTKEKRLQPFYKLFRKITKRMSTSDYIKTYKKFVVAVFEYDKVVEQKKSVRVELGRFFSGRELKHYLKQLEKILTMGQLKVFVGKVKRANPSFLGGMLSCVGRQDVRL